ncbi:hypothetical protein PR003_g31849, partial [Phytophthora rubi]
MAHRNLDGPIQGGRRGRKAADARQQAAAVSGSVAEADSDACTADAKLRMSGSRYPLATACMAFMEVFVLTVLIYVCGFCVVQRRQGWWRRSSHGFQAADLRQQRRRSWWQHSSRGCQATDLRQQIRRVDGVGGEVDVRVRAKDAKLRLQGCRFVTCTACIACMK